MTEIIATESVAQRILVLRGQKVMVDADLAELYGVPTKALNQAVQRNIDRFPADFMFRLTQTEKTEVVTNCDHLARLKYSRTLPYAFTEHGALMLGNVLKSDRAVEVSLLVVRTFVQLREMLATNKELAAKLLELERKVSGHDQAIVGLMNGIRQLMKQPGDMSRPIGFTAIIKGSKT
ncbi:MAG: ORF6N domain-containing protein [Gammaproteobacteria bacterium]|nr:ORF6N domain-containing protein [Gammaproteobacteria bacterium]MBU1776298.1 ORF6N domain-containing protein [Gammaproteobacteria bacterium]MBU1968368.1 ORF6N domain-containing protein [Gammaproteobacteria bacterium]